MDSITKVLDNASSNFVENLNLEDVESFEYVKYCWFESMRLSPPVSRSTPNRFSKTVKIKGVEFTPNTGFMINF